MIHRDLSPDFRSAAAIVASRALSAARGQATAPAGTLSVRSPDGTRTVIGTDGGIRQFVGDTTPPGRPTT